MRWPHAEYILKGVFLGLLLFAGLHEADWRSLGLVALCTVAGFALFLSIGAYRRVREGYRVRARVFSFILFLILESPALVYLGILTGMVAGAVTVCRSITDAQYLFLSAAGGALLGFVFWLLHSVRQRWYRMALSLLLGAAVVAGVLLCLGKLGEFAGRLSVTDPADPTIFGAQLLLGIPLFYLLTFAGRAEETEVEIGVLCAAMALGAAMLTRTGSGSQSLGFIIPLMLYVWYTTQVLPRLRVFKHSLRGFSFAQIGRHRQAIQSFRRALQFDAGNTLAREGLWSVHRALDLNKLASDPETMAVVDLDMCLERARALLMQSGPAAEKVQEAQRLLNLVLKQRPETRATVYYWRAVGYTHARLYDEAAAELRGVLDPSTYLPNDEARREILLSAWQLALQSKPELAQRAGNPELAIPGRRMEAIAAVERQLAGNPDDQETWGLKRMLYQDLTEAEYNAGAADSAARDFDHGYTQQLGLALIGDASRWQRGAEYLRVAARGLPLQAPSIFVSIARTYASAGDGASAWRNYELARNAGRAVGVKNLGEEDKQAYFAAVKVLADAALANNRIDFAIENYHLFTESDRSGLETLRTLADLYERKGNLLYACRVTEQALLYNGKDKDLLTRKDKYYYSIEPEVLKASLDQSRDWFDVGYCLKKSQTVLDAKVWDLDSLDWAQHLAELARIVKPESLAAKLLRARALLKRGEKEQALKVLEEIHSPRPQKFASGEDEDAWYLGCRLLGDLYLYDFNKPDLAVGCFKCYLETSRSGADTLYRLAQAYEHLGDLPRAIKYYKQVTSYSSHPLAPDAQDALRRLGAA
ncbi:MAG TPA: tetratricopeptide repeat protein [Gemmataceae bacterium]|jgi:hypothetical protein|nr:tetratricopeptide repeat protein [Gemmataceae bacterium]